MDIRIVFMGSPDFSLPTLQSLNDHFTVAGVVTQPDRPAGRGRTLKPPPIKTLAEALEIPIYQPASLKISEALDQISQWNPDVIVVAAYGQILRKNLLELPPHGCVNVHASLLPRWRGAAPINAAILHGDAETGVTIMKMDPGLDTGPVLSMRSTPIGPQETAGELFERLAVIGAELLIETLPDYLSGKITPQPQDDESATYAPMLTKQDGLLDFTLPAEELARKVRAFSPWPGTYTHWQGKPLKILRARPVKGPSGEPGKATTQKDLPAIFTLDGVLLLEQLQPAGKKPMAGEVFLNGARDWGQDSTVSI